MRLYELSAEYARLCEVTENDEASTALAELSDALDVKTERIGFVLRNLAADQVSLDTEIERLKQKREQVTRQRERLRTYVRQCMEVAGIHKIACPHFVFTLAASQPAVLVDDESAIPDEFIRTKREPDKAAILRAFKERGECVPGARVERGTALQIR